MHILDFPVGVIKALNKEEKIGQKCKGCSCQGSLSICQERKERGLEIREQPEGRMESMVVRGDGMKEEINREAKVTKADNAIIPEYLWDDRLLQGVKIIKTEKLITALTVMQGFFVWWWKRRVMALFFTWRLKRQKDGDKAAPPFQLVRYNRATTQYVWAVKGENNTMQ